MSAAPQAQVSKTIDDDGTVHGTATAPMLAYAAITGKVTDPYGAPMAGATVEIHPPLERQNRPPQYLRSVMVAADSRGEYRAGGLDPGTYWVLANKPNTASRWTWQRSYRVTYYPAALDMASAQSLKLAAGQQVRADIQILKQSGVSVSGHLFGLPAQAGGPNGSSTYTRMVLTPAAQGGVTNPDSPFTIAQSDFEFKDVLPGRYTLWALTEDAASDPMGVNRKALAGLVKDVEIGPQDMAGLDLTLEPMRSLAGTVETGEACADVPMVVQLQGRNPLTIRNVEAAVGAGHTFNLQNVPAGRYTVTVSGGGARPSPIRISSATKGTRDALKEGLEAPWKDDDILKITVACNNQGGRQ
jgi:hypothetical protein